MSINVRMLSKNSLALSPHIALIIAAYYSKTIVIASANRNFLPFDNVIVKKSNMWVLRAKAQKKYLSISQVYGCTKTISSAY